MTPGRGVSVQLDRERKIRYTMSAVAEIERKYDWDFASAQDLPTETREDMIWLVWLGLKHAGETLEFESWWKRLLHRWGLIDARQIEPEHVAGWIDMNNMNEIVTAYIKAFGVGGVEGVDVEDLGKRQGGAS